MEGFPWRVVGRQHVRPAGDVPLRRESGALEYEYGVPLCPGRAEIVATSWQNSRQIHAALLPLHLHAVGRERREAGIVHRSANGEVVERLEGEVLKAKDLVHRVVEEAADARRPHTCRFGL